MPTIAALTSFTANTQAKSAEVNANFSTIRTTVNTYAAFVDAAATITGAWTFSTAPTFTNAQSFAATVTVGTGLTVTAGGLTVTAGGATITAGGLTVTAGASTFGANVTITGTCAATTFSGSGASLTALNASNITSGTLDSARLPATLVFPTIVGAASSPRNTITLADSDTLFLTATAASTLVLAGGGASTLSAITGQDGPTGTTGNVSDVKYLRVSLSGVTHYIPCLSFA